MVANDSWSEAVSQGVVLTPGNRPVKITFEYQDGQQLILKNNSLRMWWSEYISMWMLFTRLQAIQQSAASNPANSPVQPPTLNSEDLQNARKDAFPRLVPPLKLTDDDDDDE